MGIVGFHSIAVFGADAIDPGNEYSLIIVAGKGGGHIILDKRTLATALAATSDFEGLGSFVPNDEGLIVAAGPVGRRHSGRDCQRTHIPGILAVVLINSRSLIQHNGRMMRLCPEGAGNIMGDLHTVATLVIQHHTVPAGTHTAVHTQGGGGIRNGTIVSV